MKFSALAVLNLVFVIGASAQDAVPTGGQAGSSTHIVTRTRTVAIFDDLEHKVMTAVQKKDKSTLADLTTEDFEQRRASAPAEPEPRDAWIANELQAYDLRDFRVSQMAVHLCGEETAVVSMSYRQSATVNGKDRSDDFFVVDVWRKHENSWKLRVRYMSPASAIPVPTRTEDKKPTGKQ